MSLHRLPVRLILATLVAVAIATAVEAKGWLGIRIKDITPEAAGALALPDDDGVLVVGLTPAGPAALAGVQAGDVVVSADGVFLGTTQDFLSVLEELSPGRSITLELIRWGRLLRLRVVLGTPVTQSDRSARMSQVERTYRSILPGFWGGDAVRAARQLLPLARIGHPGAQNLVGLAHEMGAAPDANMTDAAHWYRLAAEQGAREAQHNLAALYQRGLGVPQDQVRAYYWYKHAADQGDKEAGRLAGQVAQRMSPRMVEEAERLIRLARVPKPSHVLPKPSPPTTVTPEPEKQAPPEPATTPKPQPPVAATPPASREPPAKPLPQPKPGPTRDDVAKVQRLLSQLGFDAGPVDGIPGRRTRAAVKAFQASRGLQADGEISSALLDELREAVATAPPPKAEPPEPPKPPKKVAKPEPDKGLELPLPPDSGLDDGLGANEPPPPPPPPKAETSDDDLGDLGFPSDLRIKEQ